MLGRQPEGGLRLVQERRLRQARLLVGHLARVVAVLERPEVLQDGARLSSRHAEHVVAGVERDGHLGHLRREHRRGHHRVERLDGHVAVLGHGAQLMPDADVGIEHDLQPGRDLVHGDELVERDPLVVDGSARHEVAARGADLVEAHLGPLALHGAHLHPHPVGAAGGRVRHRDLRAGGMVVRGQPQDAAIDGRLAIESETELARRARLVVVAVIDVAGLEGLGGRGARGPRGERGGRADRQVGRSRAAGGRARQGVTLPAVQ